MPKKITLMIVACLLAASNARAQKTYYKEGVKYYEDTVKHKKYVAEWRSYFLPGAGYNMLIPEGRDSVGTFNGLTIEYVIASGVVQNNNTGPSHYRFYSRISLMNNPENKVGNLLLYNAGINLSFERNPRRNFLVPYFGLELGGLSNRELKTIFHFTPTFGVHVAATRGLFVNLTGGYMYPLANFDQLSSYMVSATVNFALW